jgi:hypothetical protein
MKNKNVEEYISWLVKGENQEKNAPIGRMYIYQISEVELN